MPRAAVFNSHLAVFGGGEKSTYATASALAANGYEVDVVTYEQALPTQRQIDDQFGPGHCGFRLRTAAASTIADFERRDSALTEELRPYDLFVNHCASSSVSNPCRTGLYWVMFPFQGPGPFTATYQSFACISDYTERYTRLRWGRDLPTAVIYPSAEPVPPSPLPREKLILNVGRFNLGGHTKNQAALIDAFAACLPDLPAGWRLVLAGKVNAGDDNRAEVDRLRERCRGLPVTLELDITEERKRHLLQAAAIYWHGTGIGRREPEEADRMEHYGIAVAQAMGSGAIPLAYARGGPREIVAHARTGFLYRDLDELRAFTVLLASDGALEQRFRAAGIERAKRFDRPAFDEAVAKLLRSVVRP